MAALFGFGERHPDHPVPVFNERAVRAAAGLMFVPALVTFMHALLLGNFQPTRVFIVVFVLDMALRVLVNPRWSPSLILGQWFVRHQQPEWTGAPQKRVAWGLGLALGLLMFWLMVLHQVIGPINMLVCGSCLVLMFFESAFGICLGCKLYNLFHKDTAQLCPGGVCATEPERGSAPDKRQWLALAAAVGIAVLAGRAVTSGPSSMHALGAPAHGSEPAAATTPDAEAERCKVPAFAKAMGHEAMWKQHNNCPL